MRASFRDRTPWTGFATQPGGESHTRFVTSRPRIALANLGLSLSPHFGLIASGRMVGFGLNGIVSQQAPVEHGQAPLDASGSKGRHQWPRAPFSRW